MAGPEVKGDITLRGLKYGELLGRPLSKSVYRQLEECEGDCLVSLDEQDALQWSVTVYGKVNWCPPDCKADTDCACTDACRCRNTRRHQHLLVGSDGAVWKTFVYLFPNEFDQVPMSRKLWQDYEPLAKLERDLKARKSALGKQSYLKHEFIPEHEAIAAQLVAVERECKKIDRRNEMALGDWIRQALAAIPVLLLR